MERTHRLFDRCLGIELVDLQQIDVSGAEPFKRGVYGVEDGRPRKSSLVDVVPMRVEFWHGVGLHSWFSANDAVAFSGNDDQMTGNIELA